MGKAGKREFVQVLRLMEVFRPEEVAAAVREAMARGRIGFDAVKHLVLCRIERRPPRLDLTVYPYLPRATVATTSARTYMALLAGAAAMTDTPQVLLAHHLKALKLPTFLREYDKLARQCAAEGVDHTRFLLRLAELELIDRERRMVERRIREARFPAVKSLDSFDFLAMPSLNKTLVLELARCGVRRAAGERDRARQQRHRQDPHRARARPGGLPEGAVGRRSPRPPPWCTSCWRRATRSGCCACSASSPATGC